MPVGFVLSGGGAKGSFQVGALRYLYDQQISPDIICGCSVGSINGAKIAEGEGAPGQGLAGLEKIWLSLNDNNDMYIPAPWLNDLRSDISDWIMGKSDMPIQPKPDYSEWGDLAFIKDLQWIKGDGDDILKTLSKFSSATSVFTLDPIVQRLRGGELDEAMIATWSQGGKKLRLAVVSLNTGKLRYVTETGGIVERDQITPVQTQVQPLCDGLVAKLEKLEREFRDVADSYNNGRPPPGLVGLRRRIDRQKRLIRECRANTPPQLTPLNVSIVSGVIVSALMPAIFGAGKLGSEFYVDGGIREVLPIQAAIDLGADDVYAIMVSPAGVELREAPLTKPTIADQLMRSLVDISLNELQYKTINPFGGWGSHKVNIIMPDDGAEIHDSLTVDPGLIRINMAYGYMRAADVVGGISSSSSTWELAKQITLLRREIWELECDVEGQPVPGKPGQPVVPATLDPNALAAIWERKKRLQQLIDDRANLGGSLPGDSSTWPQQWEAHPWTPRNPNTPPPPIDPACASIRASIATKRRSILRYKESLKGLTPKNDQIDIDEIKEAIDLLETEIVSQEKDLISLNCGP